MKILVTGGAGFIGSAVIRLAISRGLEVVNLDKLTYSANLSSLDAVCESPLYEFEQADICDGVRVREIFAEHQPDCVMHLAAESHVDRSIDGPAEFMTTNILGTFELLESSLMYYRTLTGAQQKAFRFHHISTDEVYGALSTDDPPFTPTSPYDPRSPYSASKAASDHLVTAWHHTFALPMVISNASNNYGPFQFPEKLIPLMIIKGLRNEQMPVYGNGANVRDWIYVDDHAKALIDVVQRGMPGEKYLVGAESEQSNLSVVEMICDLLDEMQGTSSRRDLIHFVDDRPGHDHRYAIDNSKVRQDLEWEPTETFYNGLKKTVRWYIENEEWWEPIVRSQDTGNRLGLSQEKRANK